MRACLLALTTIIGLTALVRGILLLAKPKGRLVQLNSQLLNATPFSNYTLPGLLLIFVIGGLNAASTFLLMSGKPMAHRVTFYAGLSVIAWMSFQLLLPNYHHLLELTYMTIGSLITLISYEMLRESLPE